MRSLARIASPPRLLPPRPCGVLGIGALGFALDCCSLTLRLDNRSFLPISIILLPAVVCRRGSRSFILWAVHGHAFSLLLRCSQRPAEDRCVPERGAICKPLAPALMQGSWRLKNMDGGCSKIGCFNGKVHLYNSASNSNRMRWSELMGLLFLLRSMSNRANLLLEGMEMSR